MDVFIAIIIIIINIIVIVIIVSLHGSQLLWHHFQQDKTLFSVWTLRGSSLVSQRPSPVFLLVVSLHSLSYYIWSETPCCSVVMKPVLEEQHRRAFRPRTPRRGWGARAYRSHIVSLNPAASACFVLSLHCCISVNCSLMCCHEKLWVRCECVSVCLCVCSHIPMYILSCIFLYSQRKKKCPEPYNVTY